MKILYKSDGIGIGILEVNDERISNLVDISINAHTSTDMVNHPKLKYTRLNEVGGLETILYEGPGNSYIPILLNHDSSKVIGHATVYEGEFRDLVINAISNDTPDFSLSWGVRCDHTTKIKNIMYLSFNPVPVYPQLYDDQPYWNLISEVGLPSKEFDWVLVKTDFLDGKAVPYVAELRQGQWWARDIPEGPIEEILGNKVIAWFDMQTIR